MLAWGIALFFLNLLLMHIPVLDFAVMLPIFIYCGIRGHELAWQNRRYNNFDQFQAVENKWKNWGIAGTVLVVALVILIGILGP